MSVCGICSTTRDLAGSRPILILRPLTLSDAPAIQRHFNNWNIIKTLATVVPWPYPDDGAETFVKRELGKIAAGEETYQ